MDPPMTKKPLTVIAARIFLLLNALVWFSFAVLVATHAHPGLPDSSAVRWIMGILAFGCACALIALVVLLGKHNHIAYYLILGLLVLLAVLTIADEVGLADMVYLVLVFVPLVLLIKDRSWYLR
jgi:hypothetical protein